MRSLPTLTFSLRMLIYLWQTLMLLLPQLKQNLSLLLNPRVKLLLKHSKVFYDSSTQQELSRILRDSPSLRNYFLTIGIRFDF
ncbi:hypothetical protein NIES4072_06920 [Nostoc commune NIES-4072]|uniref:Uncharacterized protein n=1 Tax=Nostoc commune NIES-4072 TaxID=2005467 RepID=A0A2R5FN49_NOSCO|nr:hypothetical protein NIES4070_19910 [Nostoc commune HK-02]GBG17044.1 hypothetical protein NIES4072_06920 [Nostoc commune NIES-4072]